MAAAVVTIENGFTTKHQDYLRKFFERTPLEKPKFRQPNLLTAEAPVPAITLKPADENLDEENDELEELSKGISDIELASSSKKASPIPIANANPIASIP